MENSTVLMYAQNGTFLFYALADALSYNVFTNILSVCQETLNSESQVWGYIQIVILLTAFPINAALIWLLLKGRTESSTASIFSINLSILNILYLFCLTLKIYITFNNSSSYLYILSESLSCLNLVGCPLLLTCMCVERYVAVVWPITYMQAKKVYCRIAFCALAWILALDMALVVSLIQNLMIYAWCVAVSISILYLLMLLCLGGIIHALCKKSPGNSETDRMSVKRKALKNVVAVLVPFSVAYLPMIGLIPLMSVITASGVNITTEECLSLQTLMIFPNIAIYIGPTFYLQTILKLFICRKRFRATQTPVTVENNSAADMPTHTNPGLREDSVTRL